MSVHALAMETYVPALRTLSELLDKGIEHSKAKGTDAAALLKERLASDMFPLALQVQLACHHAKDGTARATVKSRRRLTLASCRLPSLKPSSNRRFKLWFPRAPRYLMAPRIAGLNCSYKDRACLKLMACSSSGAGRSRTSIFMSLPLRYPASHRCPTGQARLIESNHERPDPPARFGVEGNSSVAWSDDQRTTSSPSPAAHRACAIGSHATLLSARRGSSNAALRLACQ